MVIFLLTGSSTEAESTDRGERGHDGGGGSRASGGEGGSITESKNCVGSSGAFRREQETKREQIDEMIDAEHKKGMGASENKGGRRGREQVVVAAGKVLTVNEQRHHAACNDRRLRTWNTGS